MPINVRNLYYTYDRKAAFSKDALVDISLDVEKGDFLGVVGKTGSGKSTLISHFNGLTEIQRGTILVDDADLSKKYDKKKLRARVGMVFQYPEYQLFAETVKDDVAFGPKNLGLDSQEIASRVKESITLSGLDYEEIKDKSPFELSGGQMRRVAFAGIIAMKPDYLVLDEPTAGLDPAGKRDIMSLIRRLKQNMEAVIVVSHNMNEIMEYCNKVAVLDNGKLMGVFTPKELFSDTSYAKSFNLEVPSVVRLATKLRDKGIDIPLGITDESELIRAILACKGANS